MKKIVIFLILGLLISFSFAADCNTSYTDELNIRALDAMNRPLANVSIIVYYQLSSSSGKGYVTSTPKLTNENGAIYIKIQNLEEQENHLDCDMVITAEYGDKTKQRTITANYHPNLVDLQLDVYSLFVTVKDQNNQRLEGALISVDLFEAYTNENGWAVLRIGTGEKVLYTKYRGAERENTLTIDSDEEFEVSFFLSDLILTVTDDDGNPLEAKIIFELDEYYTDAEGKATIPDIGTYDPEITVEYGDKYKYPEIDLSRENEYDVIFDFNAPNITNVKEKEEGEITILLITIEDEGNNPSGVNADSLSVHYDPGTGWKQAKVYSKGGSLYAAEIGTVLKDTVILFEIYVEDNDGNSKSITGQYSSVGGTINGNDDGNGGGNDSNGEELDLCGIGLNLIGLLLVVTILYFLYSKFIKKEE